MGLSGTAGCSRTDGIVEVGTRRCRTSESDPYKLPNRPSCFSGSGPTASSLFGSLVAVAHCIDFSRRMPPDWALQVAAGQVQRDLIQNLDQAPGIKILLRLICRKIGEPVPLYRRGSYKFDCRQSQEAFDAHLRFASTAHPAPCNGSPRTGHAEIDGAMLGKRGG